jgi:hypothetical protein
LALPFVVIQGIADGKTEYSPASGKDDRAVNSQPYDPAKDYADSQPKSGV